MRVFPRRPALAGVFPMIKHWIGEVAASVQARRRAVMADFTQQLTLKHLTTCEAKPRGANSVLLSLPLNSRRSLPPRTIFISVKLIFRMFYSAICSKSCFLFSKKRQKHEKSAALFLFLFTSEKLLDLICRILSIVN